jgi:hypothetical protein
VYEIFSRKKAFQREFEVEKALDEKRMPSLDCVASPLARTIISRCWEQDPINRPSFSDIVASMENETFS